MAEADEERKPLQEDELPAESSEITLDRDVLEALADEHEDRVKELVRPLHYADLADLLERLNPDNRRTLVKYIADDFNPDILVELDENVREEIFSCFRPDQLAVALAELDIDDAVYVIEELEEADQREILKAMPAEERILIQEALSFPEDSAGRLMQREFVAAPTFWSVGDTIDFLRRGADYDGEPLPEVFYSIFMVDPGYRLRGMVPLARLLRSKRDVALSDIMDTEMKVIPVTTDQEEVAFLFRQRDLVSAPVVDDAGRLVGVITIDDVVDVIDEEHEEDMMRLGGLPEGDLYSAVVDTAKARVKWLSVNLVTAFLAASVIGLFEATIDKIVALAILMPIVAGMGGNAGTQSLTVTVRAIAMRELTRTNALRVLGKETLVGLSNGLVLALPTGTIAWVWFGSPGIGLVIGTAMIATMLIAALAGTVVPILLEKLKVDPAVASSVFVTTMTDAMGFFVFLGLATLFLL